MHEYIIQLQVKWYLWQLYTVCFEYIYYNSSSVFNMHRSHLTSSHN